MASWSWGFASRALVVLIALASSAQAHSWVEQLTVIGSNGTFVGAPGYARGNVQRTDPAFNDNDMTHLIPPNGRTTGNAILPTDLMCMSSQTTQNYSSGSPMLQAVAGSYVALRYQENGHVTLPWNQPGKQGNRGTMYIYGTSNSSPNDTYLGIHRVWNVNGTGGDGRGVLLATLNFDDSRCYQINSGNISEARQKEYPHTANQLMGADMWCQADIALPTTLPSGQTYTLYWVWDWPTLPGVDPTYPNGKNESYTTCMDIQITSNGTSSSAGTINYAQSQDLNNAAIPCEMQLLANPNGTASLASCIPPSTDMAYVPGGTATSAAAATTTAAATTSAAALSSALVQTTTAALSPEQTFSAQDASEGIVYLTLGATPGSPELEGDETSQVSTPSSTTAAATNPAVSDDPGATGTVTTMVTVYTTTCTDSDSTTNPAAGASTIQASAAVPGTSATPVTTTGGTTATAAPVSNNTPAASSSQTSNVAGVATTSTAQAGNTATSSAAASVAPSATSATSSMASSAAASSAAASTTASVKPRCYSSSRKKRSALKAQARRDALAAARR